MKSDQLTPTKHKWTRIAPRCYECVTATAQAFIFGAIRPTNLWALSVYWSGGNFSRVENGFRRAKSRAQEWMPL